MSNYDMDLTDLLAKYLEESSKLREVIGGTNVIGTAYQQLISVLEGAILIAPFAQGDRVELACTPDLGRSPGWQKSAHFLVAGAKATVHSIRLDSLGWRVLVTFDDESWVSSWGKDAGKINRVEPGRRSLYTFGASHLRKIGLVAPGKRKIDWVAPVG
jgi:hypothetical protein